MSRAGISNVKTKGEKEASRPRGSRGTGSSPDVCPGLWLESESPGPTTW